MSAEHTVFARALRDHALPPPARLAATHGGATVADRFAVYRANHVVSLRDALADQFPVCRRLVGEAFFDAMAMEYVHLHPPREAALQRYGATFPEFVAGFPPCASVEYLADVAALEFAWREAWGATDAQPLRVESLDGESSERLLDVPLAFHPAVRRLRSTHPVASIWLGHQGDGPAAAPVAWQPEDVLLCRPDADVTVDVLDAATATLLDQLAAGTTLAEAAGSPAAAADSAALFVALVRRGVFLPPVTGPELPR